MSTQQMAIKFEVQPVDLAGVGDHEGANNIKEMPESAQAERDNENSGHNSDAEALDDHNANNNDVEMAEGPEPQGELLSNEQLDNADAAEAAPSSRGKRKSSRNAAKEKDKSAPTPTPTPKSKPTGAPKRKPLPTSGMEAVNYHEIPPYPQEVRSSRLFAGPIKKHDRFRVLMSLLFGPEVGDIDAAERMRDHWAECPVLPVKGLGSFGGPLQSPWLKTDFYQSMMARHAKWLENYRKTTQQPQKTRDIPEMAALPETTGELVTFVGPASRQTELRFKLGRAVSLHSSGAELPESNQQSPAGWMIDVGGIPLAAEWAPLSNRLDQLVAFAVIPHKDQAYHASDDARPTKEEMKIGSIQFWRVNFEKDVNGNYLPARKIPHLVSTVHFDWGRAKRLKWCPVATEDPHSYGMLAVLTGDGVVHVLDVKVRTPPSYEWVETPVASLDLTSEYKVTATCLTWINTNRIALGHSDGSITLWSIYPTHMLQRLPVHPSHVIDICSAYPSRPYLVASVPIGGSCKVHDFSRPSQEQSYGHMPVLTFQPNMLAWTDHMEGFIATYPLTSAGNTGIAFIPHKYFPTTRPLFYSPSMPMCVSMGTFHPFVLIGCADGSLWAFNAIRKIMFDRGEKLWKMKIFEHEFRPVLQNGPEDVRGAARILQGFVPETNTSPRSEGIDAITKPAAPAPALAKKDGKNTKASSKQKTPPAREVTAEVDGDEDEEEDVGGGPEASRHVVHEALSRVSAVAWNPNPELSWWAVAGMGSGLVRILDLGIEPINVPKQEPESD